MSKKSFLLLSTLLLCTCSPQLNASQAVELAMKYEAFQEEARRFFNDLPGKLATGGRIAGGIGALTLGGYLTRKSLFQFTEYYTKPQVRTIGVLGRVNLLNISGEIEHFQEKNSKVFEDTEKEDLRFACNRELNTSKWWKSLFNCIAGLSLLSISGLMLAGWYPFNFSSNIAEIASAPAS